MAEFIKTKLKIDHKFNSKSKRHFLNGIQSVYHCHHYTILYTQLALDAGETELLKSTAENSFYKILNKYFAENNITETKNRVEIATQYYSAMGLGVLEVDFIGDFSATIISKNSHVEQGWIKKWGKFDKSINFIGCGYVSAMLSAILGETTCKFETFETQSIVKGSEKTIFKSYKK